METPSNPFGRISGDETRVVGVTVSAGPPASEFGNILPGTKLADTYIVEEFITRGGMGEVYRARDPLDEIVAIKVILPEFARDQKLIEGFEAEGRKLRRIQADGVVRYYGFFKPEGQSPFLVMEFVEGRSLADIIASNSKLSVAEVRQLCDRVAGGLAVAHERGVIHRDLAPDNIILVDGRADQAKIIDFGIAKSTRPGDHTIVGTSDFAGKLSWVAPEQLGLPDRNAQIGPRTDIYSLGLVLAYAASGSKVLQCDTIGEATTARLKIPDLSRVPAELRAEIAVMLDPDPARRPASMLDIVGRQPAAKPTTRGRFPWILGLILAVTTVAIAGFLVFHFAFSPNERAPQLVAKENVKVLPPSVVPSPAVTVPPTVVVPPLPIAPPVVDGLAIEKAIRVSSRQFQCADIQVSRNGSNGIVLAGFVSTASDRTSMIDQATSLSQGLAISAEGLEVVPRPFCDVREFLLSMPHDQLLTIIPDHGDQPYRLGEPFRVTISGPPGQNSWVSVDLFDAQGGVGHMLPDKGRSTYIPAGKLLRAGWPAGKATVWAATPPAGPVMIMVIARRKLPSWPSSQVEDATEYLHHLRAELSASDGTVTAAAYKMVDTIAAPQ